MGVRHLGGDHGRVRVSVVGIDSDNGSEFINAHLLACCEKEKSLSPALTPDAGTTAVGAGGSARHPRGSYMVP